MIAWMPDGKQLQVVRARSDRTSQIGTVTIQDGTFRSLKSLEWRVPNALSLSPDGRYLAYNVPAGEAGSPRDIVVLATDGSQETTAVKNPANDSFPQWSPDGSQLLFLSDRTGRNSLWMVPIQNGRALGAATSIKADVGPISLRRLTNSGTLVYVEPRPGGPNIQLAELDGMRATKPPVAMTERVINQNFGPVWSRNGQQLAYCFFPPDLRGHEERCARDSIDEHRGRKNSSSSRHEYRRASEPGRSGFRIRVPCSSSRVTQRDQDSVLSTDAR